MANLPNQDTHTFGTDAMPPSLLWCKWNVVSFLFILLLLGGCKIGKAPNATLDTLLSLHFVKGLYCITPGGLAHTFFQWCNENSVKKGRFCRFFAIFFKFPALFSKRNSWDFLGTFYLFFKVLCLLETLEYFSIFCFYNQIQWFRDLTCQETFSILLWIFKGNSVWLRDE